MSRTALLDVNVLLALFDGEHLHHEAAHDWFSMEREGGWATCPLTENAFVRQLSNPKYYKRSDALQITAFEVLSRLRQFCASGHHVFWQDDLSLRALSLDKARYFGHRQVTDLYLLALARKNGGKLVTFDKSIPWSLLKDGGREHLEVLALEPDKG
jgi:toxin-antitoxin system PIN domain toxin